MIQPNEKFQSEKIITEISTLLLGITDHPKVDLPNLQKALRRKKRDFKDLMASDGDKYHLIAAKSTGFCEIY